MNIANQHKYTTNTQALARRNKNQNIHSYPLSPHMQNSLAQEGNEGDISKTSLDQGYNGPPQRPALPSAFCLGLDFELVFVKRLTVEKSSFLNLKPITKLQGKL